MTLRMKKYLTIFVSLVFLSFSTSSISAFDFGSFSDRFRQEEREELREEKRATIEAEREERRVENREERLERMRNLFGIMIKRYEAAIARLEKLIAKIESRIAKIKEDDPAASVVAIESQIETAKGKLALLPAKIAKLESDFEALLASSTPKDAFKSLVKDATALKSDLKDIHKILVRIIGDIKGLRFGEDK